MKIILIFIYILIYIYQCNNMLSLSPTKLYLKINNNTKLFNKCMNDHPIYKLHRVQTEDDNYSIYKLQNIQKEDNKENIIFNFQQKYYN